MKLALFSILLPLVTSTPLLNVDIRITDDTGVKHAQHTLDQSPVKPMEQIPGWVFVEQDTFRARIHGFTYWNVKGKLKKDFPLEDFLFDPLIFTLNHPEDFKGDFNGTISTKNGISLTWQSGATIRGRSPIGDYEISGTTEVDYSP